MPAETGSEGGAGQVPAGGRGDLEDLSIHTLAEFSVAPDATGTGRRLFWDDESKGGGSDAGPADADAGADARAVNVVGTGRVFLRRGKYHDLGSGNLVSAQGPLFSFVGVGELCVAPRWRGRGLGGALLSFLTEDGARRVVPRARGNAGGGKERAVPAWAVLFASETLQRSFYGPRGFSALPCDVPSAAVRAPLDAVTRIDAATARPDDDLGRGDGTATCCCVVPIQAVAGPALWKRFAEGSERTAGFLARRGRGYWARWIASDCCADDVGEVGSVACVAIAPAPAATASDEAEARVDGGPTAAGGADPSRAVAYLCCAAYSGALQVRDWWCPEDAEPLRARNVHGNGTGTAPRVRAQLLARCARWCAAALAEKDPQRRRGSSISHVELPRALVEDPRCGFGDTLSGCATWEDVPGRTGPMVKRITAETAGEVEKDAGGRGMCPVFWMIDKF